MQDAEIIKAVSFRVNFIFSRPAKRSDHVILPTDLVVYPLLVTIPTNCPIFCVVEAAQPELLLVLFDLQFVGLIVHIDHNCWVMTRIPKKNHSINDSATVDQRSLMHHWQVDVFRHPFHCVVGLNRELLVFVPQVRCMEPVSQTELLCHHCLGT